MCVKGSILYNLERLKIKMVYTRTKKRKNENYIDGEEYNVLFIIIIIIIILLCYLFYYYYNLLVTLYFEIPPVYLYCINMYNIIIL